jgi:hypothetical protein
MASAAPNTIDVFIFKGMFGGQVFRRTAKKESPGLASLDVDCSGTRAARDR